MSLCKFDIYRINIITSFLRFDRDCPGLNVLIRCPGQFIILSRLFGKKCFGKVNYELNCIEFFEAIKKNNK